LISIFEYIEFTTCLKFIMVHKIISNKRFCSLHGLIRGENMELGRDSDTGGQVTPCPFLFASLFKFLLLCGKYLF